MDATSIDEIQNFVMFWAKSGQQIVVTLAVLVVGIVLIKRGAPFVRYLMEKKCGIGTSIVTEVVTGYYVALGVILLAIVLWNLGIEGKIVRQVLMSMGLVIAALTMILRPYLPTMPFQAGNIIKTGSLIGKVEAVTLLNTRLRTFDGLTIQVPNGKVLNDYLINYHSTPTRRVKLNVTIQYDQDIVKAKRVIEQLMVQDPRTLPAPRPVVYVLDLGDHGIALGGRAWVNNAKVWTTQCDLLEKLCYRFHQEGIQIAFPRLDVNLLAQPAMTIDQQVEILAANSARETS